MAYIDTNVFVYAATEKSDNTNALLSKAILKKVAARMLSASTSVLTWDELIWVCRKIFPLEEANSVGNSLLTFTNLQVKDFTLAVASQAGELFVKYKLKPHDAIHAATAILNGEKEIITDDADFDKVKELKRITLAEASR